MNWIILLIGVAARELKSMPPDIQASFQHIALMLQEFGPQRVGMPNVRHLDGKLWEMRLRGRDGIARAIYFAASGRSLVVVRVFAKKTGATPRPELALARQRMESFSHG